ncbi:hypothetical protein, variant [Capsaspora owczarzaki ATCC 30864]|uniref:Uncharacterized protein n=1 Tax=Capsaspora owczarzaki (strain ATCC 30864) TaxID=595528 RepID=A0A0D2UBF5_CAPO3|nr:hypothetical protein, variant [Capsaspora owczarzaki ATCC 30864]
MTVVAGFPPIRIDTTTVLDAPDLPVHVAAIEAFRQDAVQCIAAAMASVDGTRDAQSDQAANAATCDCATRLKLLDPADQDSAGLPTTPKVTLLSLFAGLASRNPYSSAELRQSLVQLVDASAASKCCRVTREFTTQLDRAQAWIGVHHDVLFRTLLVAWLSDKPESGSRIEAKLALCGLVELAPASALATHHALLIAQLINLYEDYEQQNKILALGGLQRVFELVPAALLCGNGLAPAVLQSLHTQATQRHVQLAKALYATMLAVLQVVCPSPMTSHLRISEVDQAFSRLLVQARGEDHVGLRKVFIDAIDVFVRRLGPVSARHLKV